MELNSAFDLLHKNFDNIINVNWIQQKRNLDIYNAQFLSRYGFVVQEMKDREQIVLEAIELQGWDIGWFFSRKISRKNNFMYSDQIQNQVQNLSQAVRVS